MNGVDVIGPDESLYYEILELIDLKQEGEYWDFKKEWHKEKSDLLHDIICMANNLLGRDAYIIFGVDEETDFEICGVANDVNRKKTQDIVTFLRDKKFSGGNRPTVFIKTLGIQNKVDVLVVKSSIEVPYYLEKRFHSVEANNIYTRIGDTNTPKDKSADRHLVEQIWRKHFMIDSSPLEKIVAYLQKPDNWIDSPEHMLQEKEYYKYAPEFTIEHVPDNTRTGHEYYCFTQTDNEPHWYEIVIRYHQTVIENMLGIALDGGRYFTSVPDRSGIGQEGAHEWDCSYCYFILGSLKWLMHLHCYEESNSDERYAHDKLMEYILIFRNEDERISFEKHVANNWDEYLSKKGMSRDKYIPDYIGEHAKKHYVDEFKGIEALQQLLQEYRIQNINN